ncbi:pectin acetylesterase-family hydrolase [Nannocystis sp. RBIL2]|uniref:pectin acetylesterase-family hydrolase n=1 Tax=Nannocystis sp. RBIL2 TaxID=2996788 RepID=UPI0022718AA3|nr:pectin acetylesterase-family hydrolase [Nannocystis sp. RBIL2]MCY1067253.1 pectin acetylesterase-family hydrolase [Nannocystis sp. RBIL2]
MLRTQPPLFVILLLSSACGDPGDPVTSASVASSTADTGTSTTAEAPPTGSTGPITTTNDSTTGDATSGTPDTSTSGPLGSTGADITDGTTGDEPSPWDGEPLPLEPPGSWSWVSFPDSMCRDGSTTGIGVRYGVGDNLVIYFEGGGACFNSDTCALNELWKNFGEFKFDAWALGIGQGGIFDDDPQNPVRDWSFIYVPYCTGDVHAGDRENVGIDGVLGSQQFVGYRNVAAYLERIVPTFAEAGHVLVTGSSAGGFGAALNYDRIAGAFPGSAVTLLDDSGPPMSDQYMPVCMQQLWRDLFNFDATLPADCADCFGEDGGGISNLATYLGEKWSDQRLALFSSERDGVIRTFFGYGLEDCSGGSYTGEAFEAGLYELRDEILGEGTAWGSYFVPGTGHTILSSPNFYSTEVDGVPLTAWLAALLAGDASHVSP